MQPTPATPPAAKTRAEEVHQIYLEYQPSVDLVPDAARATVMEILAPALRESGGERVAETVAEVLRGIVTAVKKSGDSVWHASRGAVQGVVESAAGARADVFEALRAATRALVSEQLALEGDFAAAAKGAVQGAIQACEELGLDVQRAAREASRVAVDTANAARRAAGVKVEEVLGPRVLGYSTGLD